MVAAGPCQLGGSLPGFFPCPLGDMGGFAREIPMSPRGYEENHWESTYGAGGSPGSYRETKASFALTRSGPSFGGVGGFSIYGMGMDFELALRFLPRD